MFGCKECPNEDRWKWERNLALKNVWFTLKNKRNGKILTAYESGSIYVRWDETYYENILEHSWEDLRKKHCNIMKDIALKIGEAMYECKHESTEFWRCSIHYWCQLC